MRHFPSALGIMSFVLAACGGPPPAAPRAGDSESAESKSLTSLGSESLPGEGIDRSAIDPSTSACDDFYQHACGGWIQKTEIPSDESSWYRSFSVIRDRNEEMLHAILEGYSRGESAADPYAKQLGDFYGSCTNESAIEALGAKPIQPWLDQISAVRDATGLTRLLGTFYRQGMGIVVELSASQDFGDATQVLGMVWQGGLGMPEREYYLDAGPKMTELRGKYETHVANMLTLGGSSEAKSKSDAKRIVEIETMLARAWMTKEDRREPKKIDHRAKRDELAKVAPGFAWGPWLEGAGASGVSVFNVGQPEFVKELGAMLAGKVSLADWKAYLRWHVLRENGDLLSKKFVDENFAWKRALVGAEKLPERWKRCVRIVDSSMGEALARPFVKKTLGSEGKAVVVSMVQSIEEAMRANLEKTAWMDEPTRQAAFTKLSKIANKIAYPDAWRSYDGLAIDRGSYLANATHASAFEVKRQLAKMGKPVDRAEWQMSPPTVNAYYDPQLNEMVFPAGILQPPFYANRSALAVNFGGIGMVMGHELTHGFDDEGRQFDAQGNLRDWWSERVNAEFERRADCVKKQYDGFTVLGDLPVNGKLTLGENIADLGGVKLSLRALRAKSGATAQTDRDFFLGYAQSWCGAIREPALRHLVATNPHSPPNFRVNGPLSNLPEFAAAFHCSPESKMVSKNRCEVW